MDVRTARAIRAGIQRIGGAYEGTAAGDLRGATVQAERAGAEFENEVLLWDLGPWDTGTWAANDATPVAAPRFGHFVWGESHWGRPDCYWSGLFWNGGAWDTDCWV